MRNAPLWTVVRVLLLSVALMVATIGDEVALVAMTLHAAENSGSSMSVALLMIIGVVPGIVLSPWVGKVLDAFPPRAVLPVTLLASAASAAVLGLTTNLAVLLVCAALLGLFGAVSAGAVVIAVPALLEGARWSLAQGNGLLEAVRSGGFLLAPLVAGVLVARIGTSHTLFADALAYVAAAAMTAVLLPAARGDAEEGGAGRGRLLDGFRLMAGQAVVARTVLSVAVVVLLTAVFNVLLVFYVRDGLALGSQAYGAFLSAWGLGLIVGPIALKWVPERWSKANLALAAALLHGLSIVLAVAAGSVVPVLALFFAGGVGNGLQNIYLRSLVLESVPATRRGTAISAYLAILQTTSVLGFLGAGFVAPSAAGLVLAVCGAAAALIAALGLVWVRGPLAAGRARTAPADAADTAGVGS